jgi:hypothetical protein
VREERSKDPFIKEGRDGIIILNIRASLGTLISHGIFIFPREISSFSLGKMKIPWEISVPKLALRVSLGIPFFNRFLFFVDKLVYFVLEK